MRRHVTAAAPRFLLRLFALDRLLGRHYGRGARVGAVCEIGPGLGDVSGHVVERFAPDRVELFDRSERSREILEERFGHDPRVDVRGEFSAVDGRHDLVLCFEVIEHVEDDLGFLEEIRRSLRPGGRLIGSVPAYARKWQSVDVLAGHHRRYEPEGLSALLRRAGFTEVETESYGFPLINLLDPLRELYYARQLRGRGRESREEATERSGTARGLARSFNTPLVYAVARVFDALGRLPGTDRFDDGLLFSCRRPR